MFGEHAKRILDLLDKNVSRGVITAAELAHAIARLEDEFCDVKHQSGVEEMQGGASVRSDNSDEKQATSVSTATRVYPLLEMLRAAQKNGSDVMWGV
jgi:hypothetical protein